MRAALLILVLFLPPTEAIRKYIFPSDDREQDLPSRSLQNLQEHSNFLSGVGDEEEKISEEAEALESRFGPQYHNTPLQNYSEEQPLNGIINFCACPFAQHISCLNTSGVMCFTVVVLNNTNLNQKNTAEEAKKEDSKETAVLAMSSTALAIYLIFLVCFCVPFRKCRMQKRCPWKQERPAEGGTKADDSHKKCSDSETVPLMSSTDMLLTALAPNSSRASSSEDSNEK
ncbi:uncharacterized protein LOC110390343 isoform X2 [Numida meleagris]|uniref:uncharacterized protein LOC110390343 isoform X2 n=1 Tax=Numida meleagris TaxID=8996 RepID=UPI000B3DA3E3|nr:uncharacterized protein LOC110390343 isoform X2 [Numida meleagris]